MDRTYNNLTKRRQKYIDAIREHASELNIDITKTDYTRSELRQVSMKIKGNIWIPAFITHDKSRRVGRGVFNIPEVVIDVAPEDSTVGHSDVLNVSPGHETDGDGLDDCVFIEDDPQSDLNAQAHSEIMG